MIGLVGPDPGTLAAIIAVIVPCKPHVTLKPQDAPVAPSSVVKSHINKDHLGGSLALPEVYMSVLETGTKASHDWYPLYSLSTAQHACRENTLQLSRYSAVSGLDLS